MGTSGQATEWTSQQILDKEIPDEPDYNEYFKCIISELKEINVYLSEIVGDKI